MTDTEIVIYVGTRKLAALTGHTREGDPHVTGYVTQNNPEGFRNGLVSNLERAACALESLLEALRLKLGNGSEEYVLEGNVSVVLGNSRLKTYSYSSSKYFQNLRRTVSSNDIRAVIDQTRSVATLPLSEVILQSMPVSFVVNDLNDVSNPIGLEAQRLGVTMQMFTMDFQEFKNISKAFHAADIDVQGYFPKMLPVSEAVLTQEEKEEGALLVDIAADSTFLSLWRRGEMVNTRVLDGGGFQLTESLMRKWQLDAQEADKIKEQYGALDQSLQFGDELIPISTVNGKKTQPISRKDFHEAFLEEVHQWLQPILSQTEVFLNEERVLRPRYIFTGGAISLDGFLEFVKARFDLEGRIGRARSMDAPNELLVNPSYTASLGMYSWLAATARQNASLYEPRGVMERSVAVARDWLATYF